MRERRSFSIHGVAITHVAPRLAALYLILGYILYLGKFKVVVTTTIHYVILISVQEALGSFSVMVLPALGNLRKITMKVNLSSTSFYYQSSHLA